MMGKEGKEREVIGREVKKERWKRGKGDGEGREGKEREVMEEK